MNRVPPHDLEAETAVLGAILASPRVLTDVAPLLAASDFYRPGHQAAYGAMLALHAEGAPLDIVAVAHRGGVPVEDLLRAMSTTASIGAARHHARTLVDMALCRQAIGSCADIVDTAYTGDVEATLATAHSRVADLVRPVADSPPPDVSEVHAFAERPKAEIPGGEWAIPGVLRRTWRAVLVATEGVGKSTLLRQMALLPARGVHPFAPGVAIPPVRTLMVDCENPAEVIDHQIDLVMPRLHELERDMCWIWSRPRGIDVRSRIGRSDLEAAISHVRPALVCMGPVYKLYRQTAAENYELVAMEVQQVLDELRTRYQFALALEHHMPGQSGASRREERPKGSAAWLHWSEFGFVLRPTIEGGKATKLEFHRYRLDRIPASWPSSVVRGSKYPWEGVWPDGTFKDKDRGDPF